MSLFRKFSTTAAPSGGALPSSSLAASSSLQPSSATAAGKLAEEVSNQAVKFAHQATDAIQDVLDAQGVIKKKGDEPTVVQCVFKLIHVSHAKDKSNPALA